MVIRLKNKIYKYISQVWLIEIVIVLSIGFYAGLEIYKESSQKQYSGVINSLEATFNPKGYYQDRLRVDSIGTEALLYSATNSLKDIFYGDEEAVSDIQSYFLQTYNQNRQFRFNSGIYNETKDVYFILRNKSTDRILTNDLDALSTINAGVYTDKNIKKFIGKKYDRRDIFIKYDNVNTYNSLVVNKDVSYEKDVISNYEEYYYCNLDKYVNKVDTRIAYFTIMILTITFLILLKIIAALAINHGRVKIRGNFIISIVYVLKYGFTYKQTRRALILTIIGSIVFFIGYLYLLAIGGTENNILSNFFQIYPFKGSFILMTLPLIGIIYSIKKTIDISKVNESLGRINKGHLDESIVENGGDEIIDLIHNITEIKHGYEIAVEETLKNEKLKTELISNVSHDLRTPLTSIINYVNILSEGDLTEEERRDYLKIVEQKSKKLKILIDDLFEMSKINSGKIELVKDTIDIMSLIHQTIGEYSYLYEDKNIEFKIESFSEEIFMELDGKMISRAIENIVINSLKYSLEGTRVYVDIVDKENMLEIAFKNISNYEMEFDNDEIFERFARGDKSRTSKVEGSGLGLAITKSIVELHDGTAKINREGDMFKIFIYLPK